MVCITLLQRIKAVINCSLCTYGTAVRARMCKAPLRTAKDRGASRSRQRREAWVRFSQEEHEPDPTRRVEAFGVSAVGGSSTLHPAWWAPQNSPIICSLGTAPPSHLHTANAPVREAIDACPCWAGCHLFVGVQRGCSQCVRFQNVWPLVLLRRPEPRTARTDPLRWIASIPTNPTKSLRIRY